MRLLPENRHAYKSTSTPEMLAEWASSVHSVPPSAIIFHVSRCGSTLLSQALGLDKKNIVLAEVPFFDELLRAKFKDNSHDYSYLLPYAVRFYGQKRTGNEEHLFIKADSWHLFFYEQWRAFYPDIPFILLYRQPDEVIHSQMKRKGLHAIPGIIEQEVFKHGGLPSIDEGYENYIAAVLEQYYKQMKIILEKDPLSYAFDYNTGLQFITEKVLHLTGKEPDIAAKESINLRLRYNAKHPEKEFIPENVVSQQQIKYPDSVFELYESLKSLDQKAVFI